MPSYQLAEPVVADVVARLTSPAMAANVGAINAAVTDPYTIVGPAQVLDYVPPLTQLGTGGFPVCAVQRGRSTYEDDTGWSATGAHEFQVVTFVSNPDPRALAWQLDRLNQAVVATVMKGRNLDSGAWGLVLVDVNPGPTLGDSSDPEQVREYMSWTTTRFRAKRDEI